jgi:GH15 family glucan-1,4-alpha-glucosidase
MLTNSHQRHADNFSRRTGGSGGLWSGQVGRLMGSEKTPRRLKGWHWPAITVVGALTWITSRYYLRLRRQPPFKRRGLPPGLENHDTLIAQGIHVAGDNLRVCVEPRQLPTGQTKRVLCAGHRNFREPWARDLSFAAYGLLELGDWDAVRESLEVFLHFQTLEGQFPVKAFSIGVFDRYLHSLFRREQPTHAPLKPKYISGHRTLSLDGNLMLVVACLHYITKTADGEFAQAHWAALERGIRWVEKRALNGNGLISQEAYSDWADSLARTGEVLYTNIIYWKSLHEMARHAGKFGAEGEATEWSRLADRTREAIQSHFWRADLGYFVTSTEFDNLSSSGNLLAIAWEVATPEQGDAILDTMAHFGMDTPVPTQAMHGDFPRKNIALENRLGGIPEYHTYGAWLWLGAWHVIAAVYRGRSHEAELLLERISRVVLRDHSVYEVYGLDGNFISTRFYTAEAPLTWSAGMIVYAYHVLFRHLKQKAAVTEEETA